MKTMGILLCAFCLGTPALQAQTGMNDRVFLKNGSIIRGAILEMIPDSTVKIQTADGNVFVFRVSEIDRIIPERVAGKSLDEQQARQELDTDTEPEEYPGYLSLYAGTGIPTGDLSKDQSVKTGFLIGARYVSPGRIGWTAEGTYFRNPVDLPSYPYAGIQEESDAWTAVSLAAGVKFELTDRADFRVTLAPLLGILFSTFPAQTMTMTGGVPIDFGGSGTIYAQNLVLSETATSATSFMYGAAFDVLIAGRISLGMRYFVSNPEYEVEQSIAGTASVMGGPVVNISPPVTGNGQAKVNTAFLFFHFGIAL